MISWWNKRPRAPNPQTLEDASEWMLKLEKRSPADLTAFGGWLVQDIEHVRAFLMMVGFDKEISTTFRRVRFDERAAGSLRPSRAALSVRRWAPLAAAASLIGVAIIGARFYFSEPAIVEEPVHYQTAIGEQRVVTLADGTTVHLNTDSHLESRFTRDSRDVNLVSGEAHFKVAPDRSRPFRVHTDSAIVQAIGTTFIVDRHTQRLGIAVIEGTVQVTLPGPTAYRDLTRFAPLRAGERLEILRRVRGADLQISTPAEDVFARSVSWVTGVLSFNREPLANVVAEINRYHRQKIVIVDPAIAGLEIGGQFDPTDLGAFVDSLPSFVPVDVERPRDNTKPIRLRSRRTTT